MAAFRDGVLRSAGAPALAHAQRRPVRHLRGAHPVTRPCTEIDLTSEATNAEVARLRGMSWEAFRHFVRRPDRRWYLLE